MRRPLGRIVGVWWMCLADEQGSGRLTAHSEGVILGGRLGKGSDLLKSWLPLEVIVSDNAN